MHITNPEQISTESSTTSSAEHSISQIVEQLNLLAKEFHSEVLFVYFDSFTGLNQSIEAAYQHFLPSSDSFSLLSRDQKRAHLMQLFDELEAIFTAFTHQHLDTIAQYIHTGTYAYLAGLDKLILQAPDRLEVFLPSQSLAPETSDTFEIKRKKWRYRLGASLSGKSTSIHVRFRRLLQSEWQSLYLRNLLAFLNSLSLAGLGIISEMETRLYSAIEGRIYSTEELPPEQELATLADHLQEQKKNLESFLPEFHQLMGMRLETEVQQLGVNDKPKINKAHQQGLKSEILNSSINWQANQSLVMSTCLHNLNLKRIGVHLMWLNSGIQTEIEFRYFTIAESTLNRIQQNLVQIPALIKKNKIEEIASLDFTSNELLIFSDNRITESGMAHLRQAIGDVAESAQIITEQSLEAFKAGSHSQFQTESIPLAEIVNYLTKTDYIAPIEAFLKQLPRSFKNIHDLLQGAVRLLSFNLEPEEIGSSHEKIVELQIQIQELNTQAHSELSTIRSILTELLVSSHQRVIEQLSVFGLRKEARMRALLLKEANAQKDIVYYKNIGLGYLRSAWDWSSNLLRRTQDELLLAEFEAETPKNQNAYSELRDYVEYSRPKEAVLAALPFYYKQLFTGKQRVRRGMLSHCEYELKLAKQAVDRMKLGKGGGLLITGEALSGKSFFTEYVAETLFESPIYRINPPIEGSISIKGFSQAFRRQIKGKGSIHQLIQHCPKGSIFLLDDLELWWERSSEGSQVLEYLFDLIAAFGQEHFFLANCNLYAYQLISQYTQFDIYFSTDICLSPFPSSTLKQTVLDRHSSGRFGYTLNGTPSTSVSPGEHDLFFTRLLSMSKGNIGFALRLWLAQIQEVSDNTPNLHIPKEKKMPTIPDTDWLVVLGQFVLHKRLTVSQLLRIFEGESYQTIQTQLYPLCQIGILQTVSKQVFEIDPYLKPFVVRQLKKAKII